MNHRRPRRSCGTRLHAVGLVAAVAGGLGLTSGGTASAADPTLGEVVAQTLADIAGSAATYDDSTATQCVGSGSASSARSEAVAPEPLVYTANRIVVRSDSVSTARQTITSALSHLDIQARVGPIEKITLPPLDDTAITPVLSVTLRSREPVDVVALARHLRKPHHDLPASPDYLMSPTSGPSGVWPDGYPLPAPGPATPRAGGPGQGVSISVYDTGLASPAQSNHSPNVTRLTRADQETLDANPADGIVDLYYGGHEVAIAGVLNVIAPEAAVTAVRITESNGLVTDVSAARRMAATLRDANGAGDWPDLIVNAFGSPVCDVDPSTSGADMVPLGLQAVTEAVDLHDESLMVVSAGNRGTNRRFYPAAFSDGYPSAVIAIGALDTTTGADPWSALSRTGPRASFSNYGSWVDGWVPGVDLPTNHVVGLRFEPKPSPLIQGAARVSGTSFAAPYVAGLIAEQMATSGQDADQAWATIAGTGVKCSKRSGSGTAVALTSLTDIATTPPGAPKGPKDC